jgi:hypothetical protein
MDKPRKLDNIEEHELKRGEDIGDGDYTNVHKYGAFYFFLVLWQK